MTPPPVSRTATVKGPERDPGRGEGKGLPRRRGTCGSRGRPGRRSRRAAGARPERARRLRPTAEGTSQLRCRDWTPLVRGSDVHGPVSSAPLVAAPRRPCRSRGPGDGAPRPVARSVVPWVLSAVPWAALSVVFQRPPPSQALAGQQGRAQVPAQQGPAGRRPSRPAAAKSADATAADATAAELNRWASRAKRVRGSSAGRAPAAARPGGLGDQPTGRNGSAPGPGQSAARTRQPSSSHRPADAPRSPERAGQGPGGQPQSHSTSQPSTSSADGQGAVKKPEDAVGADVGRVLLLPRAARAARAPSPAPGRHPAPVAPSAPPSDHVDTARTRPCPPASSARSSATATPPRGPPVHADS